MIDVGKKVCTWLIANEKTNLKVKVLESPTPVFITCTAPYRMHLPSFVRDGRLLSLTEHSFNRKRYLLP